LKLFRLQEKRISSQDVAALSNRVRSVVIWDLIDQIAARNRKQLLVSLHRILEGGAEPLVLTKSLYTHFASLLSVKELEGRSEAAIAKVADMKPYNVKRLMTQSRGFRVEELLFALRQLHQTDSALKSRSIGGKQLLEAVLIRIIAQRPRGNSPAHISRPSS
jgi:DNA polymerase-3 subunit delta